MKLPDHLLVQFLIWQIRKLRTVKQWSSLHACVWSVTSAAAAAKLLQLCLTLCDAIDGSPPGFSVPEILQARTLEWVAISFSNACMLNHFNRVRFCATPWTSARQAPLSMGFARQEYWNGLPGPPPGDLHALPADCSPLSQGRKPQWSSLPKINLPRRSGGVKTTNKILPRALSTTQLQDI